LLTAPARAAIATVAVFGERAEELVDCGFQSASGLDVATSPPSRILFGTWRSTGEELVVRRPALKRVEIHCHGGAASSAAILNDLTNWGAVSAAPRDWRRSSHETIAAEAFGALSLAKTPRVTRILLRQLQGALTDAIDEVVAHLSNDRTREAESCLRELWRTATWGRRLVSPWRITLCGPPNVGKSSLMNRLLGFDRVIVFDRPGTTRDAVAVSTAIQGWPFDLVDTAGLRLTDDVVESAGVERAEQQMREADLVVWIDAVDQPARPPQIDRPCLWVRNKSDLHSPPYSEQSEPRLATSALRGDGVERVADEIVRRLAPPIEETPNEEDPSPVVFTDRQAGHIERALQAIRAADGAALEELRLLRT
jgi:tRNA modification GTPase